MKERTGSERCSTAGEGTALKPKGNRYGKCAAAMGVGQAEELACWPASRPARRSQ